MLHAQPHQAADNQTQHNREIRAFLSSTFKDMEAERVYLLGTIFPEIAQVCRKRGVGFTEIDLRWGITEEESLNGRTVEICLEQIDACRDYPPFFIGLLGERYGWIPTHEELRNYWSEHQDSPYAAKVEAALDKGISVTELEIRYGILDNPLNTPHARVFFRSPELTQALWQPSGLARDEFFSDPSQQLPGLKDRLRQAKLVAIDGYQSMEELGEAIKQFLLEQIERFYPKAEALSPAEQRNLAHAVYAASRRKAYVPLIDFRDKVLGILQAPAPQARCVLIHGASGRGKTAFVADLELHLGAQHDLWHHAHYLGADTDLSLEDWLERLGAALQASGKLKSWPETTKERWDNLPTALYEVQSGLGQRLVLLLDAFDQCLDADATERLRTLAASLPPKAFLIVTVTPEQRPEIPAALSLELPSLDAELRRQAIEAFLGSHGKKMRDDILNQLVQAERCAEPLFLLLVLEELRLHARHETLAAMTQTLLQCKDSGDLFLYALRAMEQDFADARHPDLAQRAAQYMAASYRGLRKNDLAVLLAQEGDPIDPASNKPRLPDTLLLPLLARLDPYCLRNTDRSYIMHAVLRKALLEQADTTERRHELIACFSGADPEFFAERIFQHLELDNEESLVNELDLPHALIIWIYDPILLQDAFRRFGAQYAEPTTATQALIQPWPDIHLSSENNTVKMLNDFSIWLWRHNFYLPAKALLQTLADRIDIQEVNVSINDQASILNGLAVLLQAQGKLAEAEPLYRRALAIHEKVLGAEHPDTASSLNNLANLLQDQGKLAEAEPLHRRALAIHEKALGAEHPNTATTLNNLASLLKDQGKLAEAEPLYRRALAIHEKALGAEHPNTATTLNNLASLLKDQGKLAEAEPLHRRALAIREKVLGAEHPDTAQSLNNLAYLLKDQGKLAEAEPLYRRALDIQEKVLGAEHPDTASSLNNLAYLLKDQGKIAEAEPLYRRALDIQEKVLGAEHPDTATTLNNLAVLLKAEGKLAEAEPLHRRALAILEEVLGAEHPDTAKSLNNLAYLLKDQGKLAEAEPLLRRALDIQEKVLGAEHPDTATTLNNLAVLLQAQGKLAEAEPLYRRALDIREKVLGAEHPDTASSLNNLAYLLKDQGKLAEAEPLYRRALDIQEKVLGAEHPDTATTLNNLALLLKAEGKLAEAEPLYRRALDIWEKVLGAEHPDTAKSLNSLAYLLKDQGKLAEAEPLYRRALAIHEKALGAEHPDTAKSLNSLAYLLKDQGKLAEAEPLHRRALAILEEVLGAEHPDTAQSLNNLAYLLKDQGKLAEAEPLYRRALAIHEKVLGAEHPDTASSLNNLANLLKDQGKLAEAEPLHRRALAILEEVLGAEHPNTATSLNSLAVLLQAQGKLAEAGPLYRRALDIMEKNLGTNHPYTRTFNENLEYLLREQANLSAEAELASKKTPDETTKRVTALIKEVMNCGQQGKLDQALSLAEEALGIMIDSVGEDDPRTLKVKDIVSDIRDRMQQK